MQPELGSCSRRIESCHLTQVPLRHHFRSSRFAWLLEAYQCYQFPKHHSGINGWILYVCFHSLWTSCLRPTRPNYDGGVRVGRRLRDVFTFLMTKQVGSWSSETHLQVFGQFLLGASCQQSFPSPGQKHLSLKLPKSQTRASTLLRRLFDTLTHSCLCSRIAVPWENHICADYWNITSHSRHILLHGARSISSPPPPHTHTTPWRHKLHGSSPPL